MVCAELLRMTAVRARIAATATAMSVPLASASWNSRSAISFSVPVGTEAQNECALAPAVCQLTGLRYAASAEVCPTHADRRRRRPCLPWRRSPIAQDDLQVHSNEHGGAVLCSVDKSCELGVGCIRVDRALGRLRCTPPSLDLKKEHVAAGGRGCVTN